METVIRTLHRSVRHHWRLWKGIQETYHVLESRFNQNLPFTGLDRQTPVQLQLDIVEEAVEIVGMSGVLPESCISSGCARLNHVRRCNKC